MPRDTSLSADERAPLVNPRALTTLATAVSLVYALHQPVRFVLRLASDVDALATRVAALEGAAAHERSADDPGLDAPADAARETTRGGARSLRLSPSACRPSRPASCP